MGRGLRLVVVTAAVLGGLFGVSESTATAPAAPRDDPPAAPSDNGPVPARDYTSKFQAALDRGGSQFLRKLSGGRCYQTHGLWVSVDGTTINSNGACIEYLGPGPVRLYSGDGDPIASNAIFFINRSSTDSGPPQHITISNLRLVVPSGTADQQGVNYGVLVAGADVKLDNVSVEGAPLDGVQVTGRANGSTCGCASQVLISSSHFVGGRRNGVSIVSGIGVTIDSNTIEGAGNTSFIAAGAAPANTGPWAGIDVEPDLTFYPIKQLTITHNTISNNGGAGVLLALDLNGQLPDVADQIVLDSNTITGNGVSAGSFLHGGVCLQGGEADGNGHLSVTNNQITNNVGYALCTTGYNMQVTVSGNTISGNTSGDYPTFKQV